MKQIILSACGGFVTVKMVELHIIIPALNRKPFNCEVCLSGWYCMGLSIQFVAWYWIPFYMAASMILAAVINSIMKKI